MEKESSFKMKLPAFRDRIKNAEMGQKEQVNWDEYVK